MAGTEITERRLGSQKEQKPKHMLLNNVKLYAKIWTHTRQRAQFQCAITANLTLKNGTFKSVPHRGCVFTNMQ